MKITRNQLRKIIAESLMIEARVNLKKIGRKLEKWNGSVGNKRDNLEKDLLASLDDLSTAFDAGEFDKNLKRKAAAKELKSTLEKLFQNPSRLPPEREKKEALKAIKAVEAAPEEDDSTSTTTSSTSSQDKNKWNPDPNPNSGWEYQLRDGFWYARAKGKTKEYKLGKADGTQLTKDRFRDSIVTLNLAYPEIVKDYNPVFEKSNKPKSKTSSKTKEETKPYEITGESFKSILNEIQKRIELDVNSSDYVDGEWANDSRQQWKVWLEKNKKSIKRWIDQESPGNNFEKKINDIKIKPTTIADSDVYKINFSGSGNPTYNEIKEDQVAVGWFNVLQFLKDYLEDSSNKSSFMPVSYNNIIKTGGLGTRGVLANELTLYKIPITSVKKISKNLGVTFGVTASRDQKHRNVEALLEKGLSGINKSNGKFTSEKALYLTKKSETVEVHGSVYDLYTLIIDGNGFNNAYVRDYVIVQDDSNDPPFATPVSWLRTQSKYRPGPKNESFQSLAGRMILGESRASLYRKRYHGRY